MAKRGYLYTSGGNSRMRFVEPGYDADDESVPGNKVIFDSNNIGTLSAIYTGQVTLPGSNYQNHQLTSWPALPFVPLCLFRFRNSRLNQYLTTMFDAWSGMDTRIVVSNSDIRFTASWSTQESLTIWWAVMRLAV